MENMLYIGISILQMVVYAVYLKEILGFKFKGKWFLICWIQIEVVSKVISIIDGNNPYVNAFTYFAMLYVTAVIMCKGKWIKKMFIVMVFTVMNIIIEAILINVMIMIAKIENPEKLVQNPFQTIVLITTQLFVFALIQCINYWWGNRLQKTSPGENWYACIGVSICCFMAAAILTLDIIKRNEASYSILIVLAILVIINFISYYFYLILGEKNRLELETKKNKEQIQIYQQWEKVSERTRKEVQKFCHDINNHIYSLQYICEKGNKSENPGKYLEKVAAYLSNIGNSYKDISNRKNTGNIAIDSIIELKETYAYSKGISMQSHIYIPEDMKVNDADMIIILGNLLDNAIEACEKIKEEAEKRIVLKIRYSMGNLFIQIKNTYNGHLNGKEGCLENMEELKTSKADKKFHGIGMKNVANIVTKYNGEISWYAEKDIFISEVLLYEVENETLENCQILQKNG